MNIDNEKSVDAVENINNLSLLDKKNILKARAKDLAREPEKEDVEEDYIDVVEFILAYETYAIETKYVRELYPLKELTPVPCTPHFVLGIINVRGQILSIIDIKKFFNLPEKGLTDLNKVIILRSADMEFGVLADKILNVDSIPIKNIQPPISTFTGKHAEYLKGVTNEGIILLDAENILSDKNIIVDEEVEI